MEIKKFRKNYDLELITTSNQNIALGDLVWMPLNGEPLLRHAGMPSTIYSAFLDANLIGEDEFRIFKRDCTETERIQAHFADKKVDVDKEFLTELKHPVLGKIEGNFELANISKFHFGKIEMKQMSDIMRVKIDQYLEVMKANKWEEYDGKIRRVYMITELVYGSIQLVVERSLSGKLDSALEKTGIDVETKLEGSKSVEYSFKHDEVPFAMRVEKIRTFNG